MTSAGGLKSFLLEHPGKQTGRLVPEAEQSDAKIQELVDMYKDSRLGSPLWAVLFSTGGTVTKVPVVLCKGEDYEYLDVSDFFPNGSYSVRVSVLPGTDDKLSNDWRIFVSKFLHTPPRNKAVEAKYGRKWLGNILMVKYLQGDRSVALADVSGPDTELSYVILYRWIKHFDLLWTKCFQGSTQDGMKT